MDADKAREHLEMVNNILAHSERGHWAYRQLGLCMAGMGVGVALIDVASQVGGIESPVAGLAIAGGVLLAVSWVAMMWHMIASRRSSDRAPLEQVRMGQVMSAVWISIVVAAFCQPHLFMQWGSAAIWSVGGAITMLVPGSWGERRSLWGGIAMLACLLVANFVPSITGYALAAGFILSYVLVGVLYVMGAGRADDRG